MEKIMGELDKGIKIFFFFEMSFVLSVRLGCSGVILVYGKFCFLGLCYFFVLVF